MYERRGQLLLPRAAFLLRLSWHAAAAGCVLVFALGLGVLGYRVLGGLEWVDALLNASMILGGMGPIDRLETTAGKIFASFYALFSGLVFLAVAGVVLAPVVHRFLHRYHVEGSDDRDV